MNKYPLFNARRYKAHRVIEAALERLSEGSDAQFPFDCRHETMRRLDNFDFCTHYVEPGYSTDVGVVFGNANITLPNKLAFASDEERQQHEALRQQAYKRSMMARVLAVLERLGFAFEWEDEWTTCSHCCGAVRVSPDGYGWQKYGFETDTAFVCGDCIKGDFQEEYLAYLEGNPKRAVTFKLDWEKHGFFRVAEDFEYGLHRGQDARPELVAAALKKVGIQRFLFTLDSVGQFDFDFSVWVHQDEAGLLKQVDLSPEVVNGPSVSAAMERGLRKASSAIAQLPPGPGVGYASIYPDGDAVAAKVPPEEFVEHGTTRVQTMLNEEHERRLASAASSGDSGSNPS